MRCPRCGYTLEVTAHGLVCRRGGMELSQLAQRELTTWVARGGGADSGPPIDWGGVWYCPADGTRTRESDGRVSCSECGRQLSRRLLYLLIEFHTHDLVPSVDEVQE